LKITFYNQLSQVFSYSGTLFNRPPGGTLLLRRLHPKRKSLFFSEIRVFLGCPIVA
jgi:hypothetical protein